MCGGKRRGQTGVKMEFRGVKRGECGSLDLPMGPRSRKNSTEARLFSLFVIF